MGPPRGFAMLRAIDLDDYFRGGAIKVSDVGAQRLLSAKLDAAESFAAQPAPELALGVGRPFAKLAGEIAFVLWAIRSAGRVHVVPSPNLPLANSTLPQGEGCGADHPPATSCPVAETVAKCDAMRPIAVLPPFDPPLGCGSQ